MAGAIKVKNKHGQLIFLNADKLEDFKKAIAPLNISEYFRQQQEDIVEEYNKKKDNLQIMRFVDPNDKQQSTLDFFAKETEIINYFKELKDEDKIRRLGRNGQLLHDMCKTYFRKNK